MTFCFQNVNDEPPQITTHPLLLSTGQDRVVLTGDLFDIQDQDSEPSDIQITLLAQPANGMFVFSTMKIDHAMQCFASFRTGRLQRFDPLTNTDRTLQAGEEFDYQEVLDGNLAFISSSEEAQIHLQVNNLIIPVSNPLLIILAACNLGSNFFDNCRLAMAILIAKR